MNKKEKIQERYASAKEYYNTIGIDTDKALDVLASIPISMHCWQGDDVRGFEGVDSLSGGIQATGNYPGRATNPGELMEDINKVFSLVPGRHRLNLHASYAVFSEGKRVERDALLPEHFKAWVDFAKERGLGLDFNPTYFSHEKADQGTLSAPDPEIRAFWVRHGIACLRIAEYFAEELGKKSVVNIWIPDGLKDTPADRLGPRMRLKESLDAIIGCGYDREKVEVAVESKVFGIGIESYTVGSHEFYMNYAAKNGLMCLLDSGHYHPTESVADKISSMLAFNEKVALHVSRPVRWDSDHVIRLDDDIREIAKEIVINGPERVILALDFFDASINRVAAWVIGMRNTQKALLYALLAPHDTLKKLQDERRFTELLMQQEELKTFPMGDVWDYFCDREGVGAGMSWYDEVEKYEKDVLFKR